MSDYKSLLPENNPDPVFIFAHNGETIFKNAPAKKIFPNLDSIHDLNSGTDVEYLIDYEKQKSIIHKIGKRYYQLKLVGVKKENILMAYSQEITKLLNSMQKEQKAIQAKDDFFHNISHEMKTPLNAITALVPLIKKSIDKDKKLANMFHIISENSERLAQLIDRLLDVQKVKNNKLKLNKETFALDTTLQELFDSLKTSAQEKDQDFRVLLKNLPKEISCDRKLLIKVISSLVNNAIKFTPNKGIVASKISYEPTTESLHIIIKDSGIGISKENQSKIFQAQQVDSSTTREYSGAGLDLFIIANIVEAFEGKIELKSELGEGSEFRVTLPLT